MVRITKRIRKKFFAILVVLSLLAVGGGALLINHASETFADEEDVHYTIDWNLGDQTYKVNLHFVGQDGKNLLTQNELNAIIASDQGKPNGQKVLPYIDGTHSYIDRYKEPTIGNRTYAITYITFDSYDNPTRLKTAVYTYGNGDKSTKLFANLIDGVHGGLWDVETEVELSLETDIYLVYDYSEYIAQDDHLLINWTRSGKKYSINVHYVDTDGKELLSTEYIDKWIKDQITTNGKNFPYVDWTDIYLNRRPTIDYLGGTFTLDHIDYGSFNSGTRLKEDIYSYKDGDKIDKVFVNRIDGTHTGLWDLETEMQLGDNSDIYLVYNGERMYDHDGSVYTIKWNRNGSTENLRIHFVDNYDSDIFTEQEIVEKLNQYEIDRNAYELPVLQWTDIYLDKFDNYSKDGYTYTINRYELRDGNNTTKIKKDIYSYGNGNKANKFFVNEDDGDHAGLWDLATEIQLGDTSDIYVVYGGPRYYVEDGIYTVDWGIHDRIYKIRFHFVDSNMQEIVDGDTVFDDAPRISDVSNIFTNSLNNINVGGTQYVYKQTWYNDEVIKSVLYYIKTGDDNNLYVNGFTGHTDDLWDVESREPIENDTIDIYLEYIKRENPIPTVETVDSGALGFKMYFADLEGSDTYFIGGERLDGQLSKGLFSKYLGEDGFPTFVGDGTSLKDIYDNAEVTEATNLFYKDYYDKTHGGLYYTSRYNFAELNKETGKFTVYDALGTPSDWDQFYFERGNFMPYNTLDSNNIINHNWYDYDNTKIADDSYGMPLYGFNEENNYYFGFYAEGTFPQDNGGTHDGKDAILRLAGDDDILVYIDGVLVLDLGGIHDAQNGTINLKTGVITNSNNPRDFSGNVYEQTTFKEIFDSIEDEELKAQLAANGWGQSDTLADGTEHSIKIFYFERGMGAADLEIELLGLFSEYVPEDPTPVNPRTNDTLIATLILFMTLATFIGVRSKVALKRR